MVDLPVWHSLSPRAVVAYLELARRFNGTNNGTLHLSVRELARAWNWSTASAARAIEELVDKGFIEITCNSGFNLKDRKRQATEYRLTVLFCDLTRQPASKTFTKWKPERLTNETLENISRSQNRATNVSPMRCSPQKSNDYVGNVSPMRLKSSLSRV
jgi:DNA-binding transcriptional regulator YhcF (GntR family)